MLFPVSPSETYSYRWVRPAEQPVALDIVREEIDRLAEEAIKVEGSARFHVHQFNDPNFQGSYGIWTLDLRLHNRFPFPLGLGSECLLVEVSDEGYVGTVYQRGAGPEGSPRNDPRDLSGAYSIPSHYSTDGAGTLSIEGSVFKLKGSGSHPESVGYGMLNAKSTSVFYEVVKMDKWFQEKRTYLQVALPEIVVARSSGDDARYRLLLTFQRPQTLENTDEVGETLALESCELVPLEVKTLEARLDDPNALDHHRVMAMNWLSQIDGAVASDKIVAAAATLREGNVLSSYLVLASELRAPGLERHCMELAADGNVPAGIRQGAVRYLGAVKHAEALDLLREALRGKIEGLQGTAIEALGAFGTDEAAAVLVEVLGETASSRADPHQTILQALKEMDCEVARNAVLMHTPKTQ